MFDPKVIVALDYDNAAAAADFVSRIEPGSCNLKIGKELFTVAGPQLVTSLQDMGFRIFLDLKFHDIPNTVAKAVRAAGNLGVWMLDVHASGGRVMMESAAEALDSLPAGVAKPILIGVTVLTSMDRTQLQDIGIDCEPEEQVKRLALLAKESGLAGVVSSAGESSVIKEICGSDFVNVTPGIRPAGSAAGDQIRIMTPESAVRAGADYLVIGRPITQAAEPAAVLKSINDDIRKVLSERLPTQK